MKEKKFDMIVEYGKWNVEVIDNFHNQSTILKSKPNRWFSNYYSGSSVIDDIDFSVERTSEGIFLNANQSCIGKVEIATFSVYGREAIIMLAGQKFILRRENLALKFVVLSGEEQILLEIVGVIDRKKQANFLGLIYLPSQLLYTVHLLKEFQIYTNIQFLILVCGYCTELFFEIDKGE